MTGITLDTGALIALERGDRKVVGALLAAVDGGVPITVPAGVVGQAWRDGARQVRLARFLGSSDITIEALNDARARAAGQLCGATRTRDVIDASVALGAMARGDKLFTSDVAELRRLAPDVEIERV